MFEVQSSVFFLFTYITCTTFTLNWRSYAQRQTILEKSTHCAIKKKVIIIYSKITLLKTCQKDAGLQIIIREPSSNQEKSQVLKINCRKIKLKSNHYIALEEFDGATLGINVVFQLAFSVELFSTVAAHEAADFFAIMMVSDMKKIFRPAFEC